MQNPSVTGIGANRNVDFNQLRQRVEPGVRGDGRRQIKRQFRVNHRKAGQKERAAQADFHLRARARPTPHCE